MTSIVRALVSLLATLLCLALAQPAMADGRADWPGYSWQKIDVAKCMPFTAELTCPPYHQKWDWKRAQWVDIAIAINQASGRLQLAQKLSNRDPHDDDNVCVTVLVVDAAGHNIMAYHQNWHSLPGRVLQDEFAFRSSALASAATIHIGSKQCRKGPHQDDAVYAAVRAGIRP